MNVRRVATLTLLTLAASPVGLAAQEHAEGGQGGLFSLDLGLSVWTIVIFLSLLLVLWKFAWGPILEALNERERHIQEALDAAARRQEEAEQLLKEHKAQLADARRQAQEIIQEGRDAGRKVREEIEARAREEGQALLERARKDIGREKDAALQILRRESVELALAGVSKLLKEKVDDDRDRSLVREYLDDLTSEETRA